jgi:hypothetical protein
MRLVLAHGWGFDAGFWDALAPHLPQPQLRLEAGYFGAEPTMYDPHMDDVLIGHSLGWLAHATRAVPWRGWVAINSFARFVEPAQGGCVPLAALRAMRRRLPQEPDATLASFYQQLGAHPPRMAATPHVLRLQAGLQCLQEADATPWLTLNSAAGCVLAAQHEPLVPVTASQYLATFMPQTMLRWHNSAGHLLPQQAAPWCAEQINTFLAQVIPSFVIGMNGIVNEL